MEMGGTGMGTFLFLSHFPRPLLGSLLRTPTSSLTELSLLPGKEHVLFLPSHPDSPTHHHAGQGSMP